MLRILYWKALTTKKISKKCQNMCSFIVRMHLFISSKISHYAFNMIMIRARYCTSRNKRYINCVTLRFNNYESIQFFLSIVKNLWLWRSFIATFLMVFYCAKNAPLMQAVHFMEDGERRFKRHCWHIDNDICFSELSERFSRRKTKGSLMSLNSDVTWIRVYRVEPIRLKSLLVVV